VGHGLVGTVLTLRFELFSHGTEPRRVLRGWKGDEPDLGKDQVLDEISNGDKKVHQGYAGLACLCIPKWEPGELVQ
jgi:hypothetical protein